MFTWMSIKRSLDEVVKAVAINSVAKEGQRNIKLEAGSPVPSPAAIKGGRSKRPRKTPDESLSWSVLLQKAGTAPLEKGPCQTRRQPKGWRENRISPRQEEITME